MTKNKLIKRVWLRISEKNKQNLQNSAKKNGRFLSGEADNILTEHFKK